MKIILSISNTEDMLTDLRKVGKDMGMTKFDESNFAKSKITSGRAEVQFSIVERDEVNLDITCKKLKETMQKNGWELKTKDGETILTKGNAKVTLPSPPASPNRKDKAGSAGYGKWSQPVRVVVER